MKKVYETDRFEYFKDSTTEYWNRELDKVDYRGVSLRDHFCLIAVNKVDGTRERVVFDGHGMPVFSAQDPHSMDFYLTAYRMSVADKLDLRTIAETREVPRVV